MRPLCILVLLTFTIITTTTKLKAQSIYEVKFEDTLKVQYTGLLVYFNEENSYMRIAYTLNNVYYVVHIDYKSVTGINSQNANYFYLKGSPATFITSAKNGYLPDYFIWYGKGSSQTGPYQTDRADFAGQRRVKSYRQLTPSTITDTYLRTYFSSNEEKYFAMRKVCGLDATVATIAQSSAKMYFIMAANTQVSDIGMSCTIDKRNLENEFKDIADALKIDFIKYEVSDVNYSRSNLAATLNKLQPSKNDIVIFGYSGHGFRWQDQTDTYPMMDLRSSSYSSVSTDNSWSVADLNKTLSAKGARLTIVLTDCCNSNIGRNQLTSSGFLNTKSDINADLLKLKRLFLQAKGTIVATAAQPGQYSWGNNASGGFFTSSFIQALREEISYFKSSTSSWDGIIDRTIELAKYKTSPAVCGNCQVQQGVRSTVVQY